MLITEYIIRCDDCPLELDGQETVSYAIKKAKEAGWLVLENEYYCNNCRGKYE